MKTQTKSLLATLLACIAISAPGTALAAEPNLEELQKKLDEAKKAQEPNKRDAAGPAKPAPAIQAPLDNLAAPNPKSASASFVAQGNDVLRETRTGLLWTRSDNGGDVDWFSAKAWCASKGPGWRLPTQAELISIYDPQLPDVQCGGYSCKVDSRFRLSSVMVWTNEPDGATKARFVYLSSGDHYSLPAGYSGTKRALCVRRP